MNSFLLLKIILVLLGGGTVAIVLYREYLLRVFRGWTQELSLKP